MVGAPRHKAPCQAAFGRYTFVTFSSPDHAEAALEALDGTPSCVPGCDMYVDFAELKDIADYDFRPGTES